jgi:hypothetical protein
MAGDESREFLRKLASGDMEVGAADPAGKDLEKRFADSWNWHRELFEDKRMVVKRCGLVQDGGAHGVS